MGPVKSLSNRYRSHKRRYEYVSGGNLQSLYGTHLFPPTPGVGNRLRSVPAGGRRLAVVSIEGTLATVALRQLQAGRAAPVAAFSIRSSVRQTWGKISLPMSATRWCCGIHGCLAVPRATSTCPSSTKRSGGRQECCRHGLSEPLQVSRRNSNLCSVR
jgi:hypothetical protein